MKEDAYNEEDIVMLSITECVCRRPKMYTVNGTIEEVYAFIGGCNSIIERFGLAARPPTPQDALNWIYNENNKLGEGLDIARLRAKYGSDEGMLACLLESIKSLRPPDDQ